MPSYLLQIRVQDFLPCESPMWAQAICFFGCQVSAFVQTVLTDFVQNVSSFKLLAWKHEGSLLYQLISHHFHKTSNFPPLFFLFCSLFFFSFFSLPSTLAQNGEVGVQNLLQYQRPFSMKEKELDGQANLGRLESWKELGRNYTSGLMEQRQKRLPQLK